METTTTRLLTELRATGRSWYRIARELHVSDQSIHGWRKGRTVMGDDVALQVCALLAKPAGEAAALLASLAMDRARTDAARDAWRDVVKRLGGIAAGALLAVGLTVPPSPAGAAPAQGKSGRAADALCIMSTRRRRKPASFAAAAAQVAAFAVRTLAPPARRPA